MEIRTINNIRCYSGDIAPESGIVFVFGSNPEGRHGAGAAKVARERFGAVYGRGEGLQGNAYALPTKDLRVTENRGFRSISPETITQSIKRLYETARQHPDKSFCIAYRNTDRASLNGYTGIEMMRMFNAAGPMPANVIVSEEWAKTGILKKTAESEFLTEGNDSILKQYDAYRVIVPGVNLAVDTRMDNVRDWYELVNDNGERLVRAANYVTGNLRSYDSAHFENATIDPDGSITLDAVAHSISSEGDVETSERAYRVTFTRKELMELLPHNAEDESAARKLVPATVFEEYTAGGYSARTYENARQADITLAFATDFTTAGEKCTEKAAGNTRIPVILNGPLIGGRTIEYFVRQLITDINLKCRVLGIDKGNLRLNIAGNGIYTLAKSGYTQADTDKLITDVLTGIQDRDGIHISSIRSGGQTGVDEAGIKAGRALGLPTTVLAPKGWAFRIVDGNGNHRDIYDERAFKARFGVTMKEAVRQAPVRNASAGPRWTPVRSRDGKWNYRDAAGHLLAGAWLDKAEPFRNGKAVIERGGTRAEINEEGVVTAILARKMGGPKL